MTLNWIFQAIFDIAVALVLIIVLFMLRGRI